jgi:hypothetical protein
MKNAKKVLGFAVIAAIALNALLITVCKDDPSNIPPEEMSVKDRWGWKWVAPDSTVTVGYSVDDDGVCTITVGGTPDNGAGSAHVAYMYTQKEGTSYVYTFEAWTQSGARELHLCYFENNDEKVYLVSSFPITNTRTTYTVYGGALPKLGEGPALRFWCADQTGTFYVKILDIKEYNIGKLTITNFSGSPGLTQNNNIRGYTLHGNLGFGVQLHRWENNGWYQEGIPIKGNTITIPVWEVVYSGEYITSFVPFHGDITIEANSLWLEHGEGWDYIDYYYNQVPITFTNGNATINFSGQMEYTWSDEP